MNQFNCQLVARTVLTTDVSLYRFEVQEGVFAYSPGQFVSFVLTDPATNSRFVRSYSIAGAGEPFQTGESHTPCLVSGKMFELVIVHVENGKGTTTLKSLPIGSVLKTTGPAGNLTLKFAEGSKQPLVFCANSTGIAPFRAMLQYLAHTRMFFDITVLWGLKTAADVYLGDEFAVFQKLWADNGGHLDVRICLSREETVPTISNVPPSNLALGRIQASLNTLVPKDYQVYICGGKSFVVDTKDAVSALFPQSTIFVERFN